MQVRNSLFLITGLTAASICCSVRPEVNEKPLTEPIAEENSSLSGIDIKDILIKQLNGFLPVGDPPAAPWTLDKEYHGFDGTLDLSQSKDPEIGCAATYQDTDGTSQGIVIAAAVLNIDAAFHDFDLSSLAPDALATLGPVKSFLKLDGKLRVEITIPLQRIGFEKGEDGNWAAAMSEDDAEAIQTRATDFIEGNNPKLSLDVFTKKLPSWGFGGKNFLDWLMTIPGHGVWPMIAALVSSKIEAKTASSTRDFVLGVMNSGTAKRIFSKVSNYTGIGSTDCMTMTTA